MPIAISVLTLIWVMGLVHVGVITGLLSPDLIWGDKIRTHEELIHMELASISLQVLFTMIIMAKVDWIDMQWIKPLTQFSLWMMGIYFFVASATHFQGGSSLGKYLFTPMSFLAGLLTLGLAMNRKTSQPT